MVSFAVLLTAAIGKSMASVNAVKARRVAPMAAKVKSSLSKIVSGPKSTGIAPHPNRLRRHPQGKGRTTRRRYLDSLPRVLAPLPADIHCESLVEEVEEELMKLNADGDKASHDSHASTEPGYESESTLVGCDELGALPFLTYIADKIAQSDENAKCVPAELKFESGVEAPKDLVYAREDFSASELALFEIKVVTGDALPELDYYAADGLVPLDGYDVPLVIQ